MDKQDKQDKQQVTRRQFLTYTLMGVGGFMAASIVMPNMRFGADPILQPKEGSEFIKTNFKVDDLTTEPQKVEYSFKQKDGWYEEEVTQFAWVYKDKNGDIVAILPFVNI